MHAIRIHRIPDLLASVSAVMTLEPGDVILTGMLRTLRAGTAAAAMLT